MEKKIVYKQAEISDEPLIAAFYKKAFSDLSDEKYPARFEWMYKSNPYQENNGFLPIWLALDNGQVVGMSSLMHQAFLCNGTEIRGAWCCDLRILPEYRRMGIATQLEKLRMEGRSVFSVSSSNVSIKIKEHLGYFSRPAFTTYIMVKQLDSKFVYNDLTRYLRIRQNSLIYKLGIKIKFDQLFSRFMGFLLRPAKRTRDAVFTGFNGFRTQKIDHFIDDAATSLIAATSKRYGLSASRSAEYLNWKYVDQINMNYQIYQFSKNNQLFSILVMRQAFGIGVIADLIIDPEDGNYSQVVQFAVSKLLAQGSIMIMCCVSKEKQANLLEALGFLPVKKHSSVFLLKEEHKSHHPEVSTLPWLIGYGDHDIDEAGKNFHPSLLTLFNVIFQRIFG